MTWRYLNQGAGACFGIIIKSKKKEPKADVGITQLKPREGEGGEHLGRAVDAEPAPAQE